MTGGPDRKCYRDSDGYQHGPVDEVFGRAGDSVAEKSWADARLETV